MIDQALAAGIKFNEVYSDTQHIPHIECESYSPGNISLLVFIVHVFPLINLDLVH